MRRPHVPFRFVLLGRPMEPAPGSPRLLRVPRSSFPRTSERGGQRGVGHGQQDRPGRFRGRNLAERRGLGPEARRGGGCTTKLADAFAGVVGNRPGHRPPERRAVDLLRRARSDEGQGKRSAPLGLSRRSPGPEDHSRAAGRRESSPRASPRAVAEPAATASGERPRGKSLTRAAAVRGDPKMATYSSPPPPGEGRG